MKKTTMGFMAVLAVVAGCDWLTGIDKPGGGGRVNSHLVIARNGSGAGTDLVELVSGRARLWQGTSTTPYDFTTANSTGDGTGSCSSGTDADLRCLTGCQQLTHVNGISGINTALKQDLVYDQLSSRWFYLGTVSTGDTSTSSGGRGAVCIAVSSGSAFPTSYTAWNAYIEFIPTAAFCEGTYGGCTANAYLNRAALGVDTNHVVVSGLRYNDNYPSKGTSGHFSHWACEDNGYILALHKSDLTSWASQATVDIVSSSHKADWQGTNPSADKTCPWGEDNGGNATSPRYFTPVHSNTSFGKTLLVAVQETGTQLIVNSINKNESNLTTWPYDPDKICPSNGQTPSIGVVTIDSANTRIDTTVSLNSGERFPCGRSWIPQKDSPEFLDGRSISYSRPMFENAVYQSNELWMVGTVGSEDTSEDLGVGVGGRNKIRVVGLSWDGTAWSRKDSILKDAGLGNADSVFAPTIALDNHKNVNILAHRVGFTSEVQAVITGRLTTDTAGTLRGWTDIRGVGSADNRLFAPIDQPVPYYFGRVTSIAVDPAGTNFAFGFQVPHATDKTSWRTQIFRATQAELCPSGATC